MSVEILDQSLMALGFVLLLVVLILLWIRSIRQPSLRRFWTLLALAWTMNLLGNLAWTIHDLTTETELASFSLVDGFYLARYLLLGLALWQTPAFLPRRAWVTLGIVFLAANAVVWPVYYPPVIAQLREPWMSFLGYAMYPVLDACLVTLAWIRYRAARHSAWEAASLLLFCAMASYGLANTLNLTGWTFGPIAFGLLPSIFWLATDLFMLAVMRRVHEGM